MRESMLELLVCPDCRTGGFSLREASLVAGEVEAGTLHCAGCGSSFPIVLGIPRLLPQAYLHHLLADLGILERFPKAREQAHQRQGDFERSVARTMFGFSLEHLLMQDAEVSWEENRRYFEQHSLVPPEGYEGLRVLDLGCGDGRLVGCAAAHARETVGFDLSRGVELARRRTQSRGRVEFVQGDVFHLPFARGSFDLVTSIGVLHHTPDPRQAFLQAAELLAPGGRINIWVYGLQGMHLEYRLSHMVPLREAIRSLDMDQRMQLSFWITSLLDIGLWGPARLIQRLGIPGLSEVIRRLPVLASYDRPFLGKLRAVFDRIQPPEASYHSREELQEWIAAAGLEQLELRTRSGRGWLALARRAE